MNLIIDVGNSFLKIAVFDENRLIEKRTLTELDLVEQCMQLLSLYPDLDFAIISSVGNLSEHNFTFLRKHFKVHLLSHTSFLPFKNNYETQETLGVDRLALASAACLSYPNSNVLVIDAGTCITYDFLHGKNGYMGGGISPGIEMRYKALHTFTSKLPLLQTSLPKKFIGNSTQNSIHVGIVKGVLHEIEGFVTQYEEHFDDLTTILTGGDAHFLRDSLKNDIFANSNFLLEGLNYILELNKDKC
jgi:type III pantothenate kinase